MDFTYSDLKVERPWVLLLLTSRKTKKKLFSQELLIKENYLCVTGQREVLIKQEVKMIPFFNIGISRETTDPLLL